VMVGTPKPSITIWFAVAGAGGAATAVMFTVPVPVRKPSEMV
jgi:hypothetical protein